LAALEAGRNSIGVEIEPTYLDIIERRLGQVPLGGAQVRIVRDSSSSGTATEAA
jgi:DNA modification methylase